MSGTNPPFVDFDGRHRDRSTDTDDGWGWMNPSVPKKSSVCPFTRTKMSAPAEEGGQDDDDILGFPGDGFEDKTDANPGVSTEQDQEGDDPQMDEVAGSSVQDSGKKSKKTVVVPTDVLVTDRIKTFKKTITGSKYEDNEWTQDTDVEGKIGPGHSKEQARRRQDIQDQSTMGLLDVPSCMCWMREWRRLVRRVVTGKSKT